MKIIIVTAVDLNSRNRLQLSLNWIQERQCFHVDLDGLTQATILGRNPFECVRNLNYVLQLHGWVLLCNGAREDAHMSGMLGECFNGEKVYIGPAGPDTPIVSIFDHAPQESIKMYSSDVTFDTDKNRSQDLLSDIPFIRRNKRDWIYHYLRFRQKNEPSDVAQIQEYLSAVGQNSSLLALRFRGCLLGSAVCDALGTSLEFAKRDANTISDMIGGGPFNLLPGQWTDDTSMALCSAESLVANHGFNPKCHMELYRQWRDTGKNSSTDRCFDIGRTVHLAISDYVLTKNPLAGSKDPKTAGNGSLMRIAPDILFHFFSANEIDEIAGVSSRITHGATEAVDACRYMGALIHGIMAGKNKQQLLNGLYYPVERFWDDKPLCEGVLNVARGSFRNKSRNEIKSTGYVVDTFEAALWAFYSTTNFKDGALLAVNLAGDADTIGAVYGQIAGAYYMEPKIPVGWLGKLYEVERFFELADDLLGFACSNYQPFG